MMLRRQQQEPHPPPHTRARPSSQPASARKRHVFQASEVIAQNRQDEAQEHFSKQHIKGARAVFQSLLARSSLIIASSRSAPAAGTGEATGTEDHAHAEEQVEQQEMQEVEKNKFAVGDRVLCNFCDHGQWCPGEVTGAQGGLYDVLYDDGDAEEARPAAALMWVPGSWRSTPSPRPASSWRAGDQVLGNYDCKGIWFEGVLTRVVQEEGEGEEGEELLFDVEYSDGDAEYGVPRGCLVLAHRPAGPS